MCECVSECECMCVSVCVCECVFMGFSRQEYGSGLPGPPPRDLPDPGIKLSSLMSPALAGGFFTTSTTWEGQRASTHVLI